MSCPLRASADGYRAGSPAPNDRWPSTWSARSWTGQPATVREFLLRTSIVERLNPSLATALSGRDDSSRVLEDLVASNAFVVSLGDDSGWFRYHPLLRELLQHRLILERPGSADQLHLRAAAWFIEQGQPIQAIAQATAAGDWDEVGRLLTAPRCRWSSHRPARRWRRHSEPAAAGRSKSPVEYLAGGGYLPLPPPRLRGHAPGREGGRRILARRRRRAPHPGRDPDRMPMTVSTAPGAVRRRWSSRPPGCSLLDAAPRRLVPAAPHYRVIGLNNLGVGRMWAGDLAGARDDSSRPEARP